MIDYDESSDLDRPAHRLETLSPFGFEIESGSACSSAKDAKHSTCSRPKAWKEGEYVDISPSNSWM